MMTYMHQAALVQSRGSLVPLRSTPEAILGYHGSINTVIRSNNSELWIEAIDLFGWLSRLRS